jgi:putative NADH-flavin reductase
MKVALIGITGHVGSRVANELLRRGHKVLGLARHPTDAVSQPNLTVAQSDATVPSQLSRLLVGNDAVVSASRFRTSDPTALLEAMKLSRVPRLLMVGGAASLRLPSGQRLIDTPDFPEAYKDEARAGVNFLAALQKEDQVDWTFLSPSAEFVPGERTTHFRLGTDELLVDANGRSWISMEDFAIALVDELEHPAHDRRRFTVGY